MFVLRLNVPVNNFSVMSDGATASWVINQYFQGVKCLAQGHNMAAVGFEPPTSHSGVRHSTTEPPRSPVLFLWFRFPNWPNEIGAYPKVFTANFKKET